MLRTPSKRAGTSESVLKERYSVIGRNIRMIVVYAASLSRSNSSFRSLKDMEAKNNIISAYIRSRQNSPESPVPVRLIIAFIKRRWPYLAVKKVPYSDTGTKAALYR